MNTFDWLKEQGLIKQKVAAVYLSNYDGTGSDKFKQKQEKLNLPPSHLRFGEYNATGMVKENEMYFWTTTSQDQWTLDLVQLQFGTEIYDISDQE